MVQLRQRRTNANDAQPRSSRSSQVSRSAQSDAEPNPSVATDYNNFTVAEILSTIIARNKDPKIERMVLALDAKISKGSSDFVEDEKRGRSLVISGLFEAPPTATHSEKLIDLDEKVDAILAVLKVECRPVEVFRMGKSEDQRPRLVKVVLPSRSHWVRALSNVRLLRFSPFSNVFVRRSMTAVERRIEFELRQEAKERNRKANERVWVVYRGELKKVKEICAPNSSGNA